MNVSLFQAQSQALSSTVVPLVPYTSLCTVLRLTTTRNVVFSTRSWLCICYPLRAQEPIRNQRSVCRRESTFDPPLNYNENLQKPEKGSRRERAYLRLFTTICQDEDRRVLDARALPIRNPASSVLSPPPTTDSAFSRRQLFNYVFAR